MVLSRRNVLIGLGTAVAGAGAVLGTGAFTTVAAARTVSVETAGDGSAFLQLTAANDDYVDDSGETIQINLDGSNTNAEGLNQNARTRFEGLVNVANNGSGDVASLTFSFDVTGAGSQTANENHEDALYITSGGNTYDADGSTNILGSNLAPGDSPVTFGIEVDLLDSNISDIDPNASITLTITAEAA